MSFSRKKGKKAKGGDIIEKIDERLEKIENLKAETEIVKNELEQFRREYFKKMTRIKSRIKTAKLLTDVPRRNPVRTRNKPKRYGFSDS